MAPEERQDRPTRATQLPDIETKKSSSPMALLPLDEEAGLLDLIEVGTEHVNLLTAVTARIAEATSVLNGNINARTNALMALRSEAGQGSPTRLKQIVDFAANDMELYVEQMRVEVPRLAEHSQVAISSYANAAALMPADDSQSTAALQEAATVLSSLGTTIAESQKSIHGMSAIIASLPRMTSKLNRAKKATVDVLDELAAEMGSIIDLSAQAERNIRQLMERDDVADKF